MKISNKVLYAAGFAAIAVLIVGTLAYGGSTGFEFGGADDKGGEVISSISPGYEPWWKGIWGDYELPGETESMLFALQAAIGAIVIGYIIGYYRASGKTKKENLD